MTFYELWKNLDLFSFFEDKLSTKYKYFIRKQVWNWFRKGFPCLKSRLRLEENGKAL